MTRGGKIALVALVLVVLFWAGVAAAVVWAARAVASGPTIEVSVREDGSRVSFRAPAGLVLATASLATEDLHDSMRAEIGHRIDPAAWAPFAAELAQTLETMPDATLVEVVDGGDRVVVAKSGDLLTVRVRSPEGQVDVDLPASLAADLLAGMAP